MKKIWSAILALLVAALLCVTLAACNLFQDNSGNSGNEGNEGSEGNEGGEGNTPAADDLAKKLEEFFTILEEDTEQFDVTFSLEEKKPVTEYDPDTEKEIPVRDPDTGEFVYAVQKNQSRFVSNGTATFAEYVYIGGHMRGDELFDVYGEGSRSYGKLDGGYLCGYAVDGYPSEQGFELEWDEEYGSSSLQYDPDMNLSLSECMSETGFNVFFDLLQSAAKVEEDCVTFDLPDYGVAGGTITFTGDVVEIFCPFDEETAEGQPDSDEREPGMPGVELFSAAAAGAEEEARPSASIAFTFKGLGTNTNVPSLAAADAAYEEFTTEEYLQERLSWLFHEDSAEIVVSVTEDGQNVGSLQGQLSDGEMLLTAAGAAFELDDTQQSGAIVRRGDAYYAAAKNESGIAVEEAGSVYVNNFLHIVEFPYDPYSYELKAGTDDTLVFDATGTDASGNVEVKFHADGTYTITGTTSAGYNVTMTICDAGEAKPIQFPQELEAAADEYYTRLMTEETLFEGAREALFGDSAEIEAAFSMQSTEAATLSVQLYEGEMLLGFETLLGSEKSYAMVRSGENYYLADLSDLSQGVTVSSGYNVRVIDVMSLLEFSRFEREYFVLKEGTTNVLTLSDSGKNYYGYCESLEIMLNKDGSYTVTATGLSVPGLPVQGLAMSMTIKNVGSTQPIAFDAEAVAAVEAFSEDEAVADELFARMEQALAEDSAVLEGTLFEAGTQNEAMGLAVYLSGGEMYKKETGASASPAESGVFRSDYEYLQIEQPLGWTGEAGAFPVYTFEYSGKMILFRAFEQFAFTRFSREYFMLKAGTENTLTLSVAGKEFYSRCEGLEIAFAKDGSVTVTITGMQYSYYGTYDAVLYITQIGGSVVLGGSAEEQQKAAELRQAVEKYDAWKNGESATLAEGTYQAAMRITNDVYTSGSNPMPLVDEGSVFEFAGGTATLSSGNITYTFTYAYDEYVNGYVLTDTAGDPDDIRLTVKYIGGKLYFGGEYMWGNVWCNTLYVFTAASA